MKLKKKEKKKPLLKKKIGRSLNSFDVNSVLFFWITPDRQQIRLSHMVIKTTVYCYMACIHLLMWRSYADATGMQLLAVNNIMRQVITIKLCLYDRYYRHIRCTSITNCHFLIQKWAQVLRPCNILSNDYNLN